MYFSIAWPNINRNRGLGRAYCFTDVADGVSFCLAAFDNVRRVDMPFLELLSLMLLHTGAIIIIWSYHYYNYYLQCQCLSTLVWHCHDLILASQICQMRKPNFCCGTYDAPNLIRSWVLPISTQITLMLQNKSIYQVTSKPVPFVCKRLPQTSYLNKSYWLRVSKLGFLPVTMET